jgi:hypothetical protein
MLIEPEFLAGMAVGAGTVVGLGWVGAVVGGAVRLVVALRQWGTRLFRADMLWVSSMAPRPFGPLPSPPSPQK